MLRGRREGIRLVKGCSWNLAKERPEKASHDVEPYNSHTDATLYYSVIIKTL
jgi:hypothetical protein